ncbi:tRNA (adenine(22)-N(1))-methyltransferase TrmK, partial [uncultured Halopseudomonas sp.]|uniref:tRNA (adenine(22)-N(1))-methyltransferase n=1 Tax=uncultured Halopseudomonas sp. TaxID=2901193 RepID=UPI0030ED214F
VGQNCWPEVGQINWPLTTHIWDCCCDHGLLGAALLSNQAAPHIHFVDVLPRLINQLNEKLQRFYSVTSSNWYTHCMDTAALPLERYPGKHLIIIAGVGGDLITRFILEIHSKHPRAQLDFLLCPVHQEYPLRQQLVALDFSLKEEVLVSDNQRFYEVLLVSAGKKGTPEWREISPVGDTIWQADTPAQESIARSYLHKTLKHYQNSQKGNADNAREAIDVYRAVTISKSPRRRTEEFVVR